MTSALYHSYYSDTHVRRCLLLTLLLGNDTTQFLLVPILHVVWLSVLLLQVVKEETYPSSCPLGYLRTDWLSRLYVQHWGRVRIYTCFLIVSWCSLSWGILAYPSHNDHSWSIHKVPKYQHPIPIPFGIGVLSWDLDISYRTNAWWCKLTRSKRYFLYRLSSLEQLSFHPLLVQ